MWLVQTLLAVTLVALSKQQDANRRVVCYYTNWSVYRPGTAKFNPQNINPYLCTHLIYAFGGLDRENGLRPYDKYQDIEQGGYAKFTGLKTYNKQLKTLLAIGGWNEGSARFSPLVADPERRREFTRNVVRFLRQNHFDGLDLDWEYPAYRDGGKAQDRENYAQLVQELREEFEKESSKTGRPRLLLTMAVPAGIEYIDKGYDIPKLNRYLDFMNILSYDYHSAFEPSVNHHSPLYSLEEDNEYNFDSKLTIDATVKHYLMKGADAEKLVLGIPTYGRSYTLFNPDSTDLGSPADGPGEQGEATREKGYLAYYEICNNLNNGWAIVQPKESAMGPYAYKDNQWVGYDDESIVKKKSQYVNERNLGGIMFWSIDNDDFRGKCHSRPYPLIEAAKEALLGKGVSNKLPSGTRGGKRSGKTTTRTTTTPVPPSNTTPEPPTTPDPGSDFVCKDEGFFPHPRDCKKYFWCLDSGPSDLGIVAHQFTCPSGLFFNKAADSCDFARNVICKKKSTTSATTTTTTSAPTKTTKSSYGKITLPPKTTTYTTTTTTTTTTTEPPPLEEEEDEDYKEEDPQTIKQLINLIKKLGGVAELEKQLEGNSGIDSTTPAISKSLYQRVIKSGSPRYQTIQRNGPSGPQNEGLPRERSSSSFRREKPQYVTIKRERPSTSTESAEIVYAVVEEEVEETTPRKEAPKYQTISRTRVTQTEGAPKYQPSERFRSKGRPEERDGEPEQQQYQSVERFRSTGRPEEREEESNRPQYQSVDRFRSKGRPEEREEESNRPQYQSVERFRQRPEEESDRPSTPRYTSILRSRPPTTSDSTATTSKYVVLQRQRPTNHLADDVGTTENELSDEEEVTDHVIETTTSRPRVKVSEIVPTTVSVPTSTRVVTEIVEGATQRQRVPLSKLRQFIKLKDLDNSVIEPVTVPIKSTSTTTEETITERPLLHGFNRRRPEIVVTTTVRTTPAFLSQRRNRFRSTTELSEISTKGRFVPSRSRNKLNEIIKDELSPRFIPRKTTPDNSEDELQRVSTESSSSTTKEQPSFRSRFAFKRRTTEKPVEKPDDSEDELFIQGNSRDANVIRKPIYKARFPSRRRSTTTEAATLLPSSSVESIYLSTQLNEKFSSATETILDGEVLKPIDSIQTTYPNDDSFPTTEIPSSTAILPQTLGGNITSTSESYTTDRSSEELNETKNDSESSAVTDTPVFIKSRVPAVKQETEKEITSKFEEENKFSSLSLVSPTEINSLSSEHGETLDSSTEFTSKSTELFLSTRTEGNSILRSRLSHGRKYTNSTNSLASGNNIREVESGQDGRKKIILRRRKPTTHPNFVLETTETSPKSNITFIKRNRPLTRESNSPTTENSIDSNSEPPRKIQRGKIKFYTKVRKNEPKIYEDSLASSSRDASKTRSRISSRTTSKPFRESPSTSKPIIDSPSAAPELKRKRIIMRGRKKHRENDTNATISEGKIKDLNEMKDIKPETINSELLNSENKINQTHVNPKQRQKFRKVLVRKTMKDLAVEESMSPGQEESFFNSNQSLRNSKGDDSDKDLDIDFTEDIIHTSNGEQEIQTRGRRPFRKTVVRSTTTTTETPTTSRQRTTAQSLRQRLNRIKSERNFLKATTSPAIREEPAGEEGSTTLKPTRKEFRRLIRPLPIEDSQLDASQDETKSSPANELRISRKPFTELRTSVKPQSEVRISPKPPKQYLEQVTEGQSEEYADEEPLVLPDLANVAVAAIQSLATSTPPTTTTEKYNQVTQAQRITRLPAVRRGPPLTSRPTQRTPARSSPRPFTKVNYDDYEDYYAEPVDVPLSGKVRIHNDGYIECLDIGNFPHPFSCRKFISCAKMENGHLLGWEYTCPKGLSFDPIGGICNWNAGLGCKE